ncbi:alpha-E domain-containing protein [Sphingorhabdus sp.]|uniref:alpha-E domain-containing protein n=1 Tax=Sphingorhabdus sp. TaxID=1902408 RepID=UPI0035B34BE9|nr:alpha-E domain-containing protein [Sphingomonadaceae bacterium]
MLGRTAGGIFWMFRYLERCENMARLLEAGHRMALTRSSGSDEEWRSVISTAGLLADFEARHDSFSRNNVVNFLLRDKTNASSILTMLETARHNARMTRTALTREVWEATNIFWMRMKEALARPVRETDLPGLIAMIRQQSAQVRGALHGSMLRIDVYNFARLGTFLERADNTARILDVKYYVLLPSLSFVGSSLDNVQWETILRSVSAEHAFRWLNAGDSRPVGVAEFLILDQRFPRSLAFCYQKLFGNLCYLENDYGERMPAHNLASEIHDGMQSRSIDAIFESGLHEFLTDFMACNARLAAQIEHDYRFYG